MTQAQATLLWLKALNYAHFDYLHTHSDEVLQLAAFKSSFRLQRTQVSARSYPSYRS